jgi:hypothetical protein
VSSPFGDRVELTATARVNGEEVQVKLSVDPFAWTETDAREHIVREVQFKLLEKILEKAPPRIDIRRVSGPNPWGTL